MFARKSVPLHPEDQRIVEIAKDLCRELNYYKVNPETITWRDKMGVRRVPPDAFLILYGNIQLSKAAMGRLTPEEWKPILASGLIYYKNFNSGYLRGFLTKMIPIIFGLPLALLLTSRYLSGDSLLLTVTRDIVLVSLMALTLLGGARFFLYQKKLWFRADDHAARFVGKQSLLSSLEKMGSIKQDKGKRRRGIVRPSVEERIKRLMDSDVGRF